MKERLSKLLQLISLKVLFSVVSFLVVLYIFAAVAHEIFLEREDELDQNVFQFLDSYATHEIIHVMRFFTFFGKPEFLIPAYVLMIILFLVLKKRNYAIEIGIIGTTSTALLFGLKKFFQRDRPDIPIFDHLPGYSFPSGHALLSFVFVSALIYLLWRSEMSNAWKWTLSIFLILFSFMVGISRIFLRVHYATDVIAGFCLGYAWVILSLWVQRRFINKRKLQQFTHDPSD